MRKVLRSFVGPLLGYDIFVSYTRSDGASYAKALRDQLEAAGFVCFFDETEDLAGTTLDASILKALRRSRMLLVVASENALDAPFVRREIEEFPRGRRIFTIGHASVRGSIGPEHGPWTTLKPAVWIDEAAKASVPRPDIASILVRLERGTKRLVLLKRLLLATAGLVAGLGAGVVIQSRLAHEREITADSRRLLAYAQQLRREEPGKVDVSALLAIESWRRRPTVEANEIIGEAYRLMPEMAARFEGTDTIADLRFLADGSLVICDEKAIRVVDVSTGIEQARMDRGGRADTIEVSPNGRWIAALRKKEGGFCLWDWRATPHQAYQPRMADGHCRSMAFTADSKRLVIGMWPNESSGGSVRLIQVESGQEIARASTPEVVTAVAVGQTEASPIAAGLGDGQTLVWRSASRLSSEPDFQNHLASAVSKVVFSGDARHVTAIASSMITLDVQTGKPTREPHLTSLMSDLAVSGDAFAVSWYEERTRVFPQDGLGKGILIDEPEVSRLALSPNGHSFAATLSKDGVIRLWGAAPPHALMGRASLVGILPQQSSATAMAFSPDGNQLATASDNGDVTVWLPQTLGALRTVDTQGRVGSFAFGARDLFAINGLGTTTKYDPTTMKSVKGPRLDWPDAPTVVPGLGAIAWGRTGRLWWMEGDARSSIELPGSVTSIGVSPNARWVVASQESDSGNAKSWTYSIWDRESRTLSRKAQPAIGPDVAIDSEGRFIATYQGDDYLIYPKEGAIRDLVSNREVLRFTAKDWAGRIAFGPRPGQVAIARKGRFEVRDLKGSGAPILFQAEHGDRILALQFDPQGRYLASAGTDGTLRVWSLEKRIELGRVRFGEPINAVSWSSDAATLAFSSVISGGVSLVQWRTEDLIAGIEKRVCRNLSQAEWRLYGTGGTPPVTLLQP